MERCGYVLQASQQQSELRVPSAESQRPLLPLRALSSRARWAAGGVPMTLSHIPPLSLVVMSLRFISLTPHCRRHPREPAETSQNKAPNNSESIPTIFKASPAERMMGQGWTLTFSALQPYANLKRKKKSGRDQKKKDLFFSKYRHWFSWFLAKKITHELIDLPLLGSAVAACRAIRLAHSGRLKPKTVTIYENHLLRHPSLSVPFSRTEADRFGLCQTSFFFFFFSSQTDVSVLQRFKNPNAFYITAIWHSSSVVHRGLKRCFSSSLITYCSHVTSS